MAAEWKEYILSELIEIIGGGTPKTSIAEYWNGNIPWLSIKDFNNIIKYVYLTEKTITDLGLEKSSTKLLQKNDIIISARGTVGELAMIPYPMAFNQSCYGIRAKEKIFSDYLFYWLKNIIQKLKAITHGSVFDTITRDTFDSLKINLPPLETQQKIAKILSALDEKIELNNKINENLHAQAQAIFSEYYNKGTEKLLGDVVNEIESGSRQKGGAVNEGVPSIGAEKIEQFGIYDFSKEKYISNEFFNKLKKGVIKNGDVLLYKDGAYTGKVSMALNGFPYEKCAVNEHVFIIRGKENYINQFYLYFCLFDSDNKAKIHSLASSKAAQPGLNQEELKSLIVKVPGVEDMLNFEKTVSPMMNIIAYNAIQNQKLAQIRDTLLPKLMSGELEV